MTKAQYLKSSKAKRFEYLFMRHPLTILFGYPIVFLYGMCLSPFATNPREHYDSLIAFVVHIGIAVLLTCFVGWPALLLTQIIPHFIASAIGTYLFYAQHNFPGVTFNDNAGWTYEKAAMESSSYIKSGPLWAWFTANIGYHHIHHLNARVPFYRLPGGLRRDTRIEDAQDHLTPSVGHHPLPAFEGVGRRSPTDGRSPEYLSGKHLPNPIASWLSLFHRLRNKLRGEVLGDGAVEITGFASADRAKTGDLTFAEKETHFAAAEQSQAAAIIVTGEFTSAKKVLIRVPNARVAVARVLPLVFPAGPTPVRHSSERDH